MKNPTLRESAKICSPLLLPKPIYLASSSSFLVKLSQREMQASEKVTEQNRRMYSSSNIFVLLIQFGQLVSQSCNCCTLVGSLVWCHQLTFQTGPDQYSDSALHLAAANGQWLLRHWAVTGASRPHPPSGMLARHQAPIEQLVILGQNQSVSQPVRESACLKARLASFKSVLATSVH